jgi:DNA-binding NarL/FixJ family response regulator
MDPAHAAAMDATGMPREVLIADDHPLFSDALTRAVLGALPGVVVHGAASVPTLLALIEAHPQAELLLMDLHMPGARGFSALAHIRGQHPGLPIVVVSAHAEAAVVRRALAHGASGYLAKSATVEDIGAAVRAVLEGELWIPTSVADARAELKPDEAAVAARLAELTPQQFRVLGMIAEGLLNKQIAYELGISEATIKAHMTAIMRKLGVSNRTQVALAASHLALDQTPLPAIPEDD